MLAAKSFEISVEKNSVLSVSFHAGTSTKGNDLLPWFANILSVCSPSLSQIDSFIYSIICILLSTLPQSCITRIVMLDASLFMPCLKPMIIKRSEFNHAISLHLIIRRLLIHFMQCLPLLNSCCENGEACLTMTQLDLISWI